MDKNEYRTLPYRIEPDDVKAGDCFGHTDEFLMVITRELSTDGHTYLPCIRIDNLSITETYLESRKDFQGFIPISKEIFLDMFEQTIRHWNSCFGKIELDRCLRLGGKKGR